MSTTSSSLLEALKDITNESARRVFIETYRPVILKHCRSFGLCSEAEDLAQELLLRLLERLTSFEYDPDRSFSAYIRRATYHAVCDVFRRRKREPGHAQGGDLDALKLVQFSEPDDQSDEVPGGLVDEISALIESDLWREAERRVRRRVQPRTWRLYESWKRHKLGKPASRGPVLAGRHGLSENAVHKTWSRVRKMLQAELERMLGKRRSMEGR